MRHCLGAYLDVRPPPFQFRNGGGIVTGRIVQRDKFGDHLAHAHPTGSGTRLKLVSRGGINLNGTGLSHRDNLERSARFANGPLSSDRDGPSDFDCASHFNRSSYLHRAADLDRSGNYAGCDVKASAIVHVTSRKNAGRSRWESRARSCGASRDAAANCRARTAADSCCRAGSAQSAEDQGIGNDNAAGLPTHFR